MNSNAIDTLSSPLKLRCGLVLPNRLVKAPMAENMAIPSEDNLPNDKHLAVYRAWSEGEYGMLITGNVEVDPRYLGIPGDISVLPSALDTPLALSRWTAWATAAQASGTPTIVQLNHPGRQSHPFSGTRSFFSKNIAPSALPLEFPGSCVDRLAGKIILGTPKAMTVAEIDTLVDQFTLAAKLSKAAGFKGVQIHAAHGYLLTQFLSPKINRRADAFGGSAAARLSLLLRIIASVRAATSKEFCIAIKLNSADFATMGLEEEEVLHQVEEISKAGVDLIEISGGTYEKPLMGASREGPAPPRQSTVAREAYFAAFAAKARVAAGKDVAIMLSGGFRSRLGMAGTITDGSCDLIGLARPTCLEPQLPKSKLLAKEVTDEDAVVKSFKIVGGWWMKWVPVVGLRAETAWHEGQIKRIAAGKEPDGDLALGLGGLM